MTRKQISDTLNNYEQACNALAREFETVLMRDYKDETEEYTPDGRWIGGEVGGLYEFGDYTANTCDMAVMLQAVEDGRFEGHEAFAYYSDWYNWMLRAANLKSTAFGAEDKHLHFINLKSWIKGCPNADLINAIAEAEYRRARYEETFNDLCEKYGTDTDTGFPKQFTNHKKDNNHVD